MARSMLSEYNVSQSFWAEAINMACYCSNYLYCHLLKEKTPYELLNGRKPNIAIFWVFGCVGAGPTGYPARKREDLV